MWKANFDPIGVVVLSVSIAEGARSGAQDDSREPQLLETGSHC